MSAPFNAQNIGAVCANVTPAYVAGGTLAEAGVVCTDAATAKALFAFFEDGEGDWEIDGVDESGNSRVLSSGVTRLVGGDITGTCTPGSGNTTRLSAPGGPAATFTLSNFSLTRLPVRESPIS